MEIQHKLYRKPDMAARYGISPVTVWRYVQDGLIPQPKYLRKACIWTPEQVAEADQRIFAAATDEAA